MPRDWESSGERLVHSAGPGATDTKNSKKLEDRRAGEEPVFDMVLETAQF